LASFELPPRREPEQLWRGDADLVRKWAQGELPEAILKVGVQGQDKAVVGVAFAQMRPEAFSQTPSAHLEVLAVAKSVEGQGLARALVQEIEATVADRGAKSITLNVFRNNERARALYGRLGYDEELLRCVKEL